MAKRAKSSKKSSKKAAGKKKSAARELSDSIHDHASHFLDEADRAAETAIGQVRDLFDSVQSRVTQVAQSAASTVTTAYNAYGLPSSVQTTPTHAAPAAVAAARPEIIRRRHRPFSRQIEQGSAVSDVIAIVNRVQMRRSTCQPMPIATALTHSMITPAIEKSSVHLRIVLARMGPG